jgi:hypothetical protein
VTTLSRSILAIAINFRVETIMAKMENIADHYGDVEVLARQ